MFEQRSKLLLLALAAIVLLIRIYDMVESHLLAPMEQKQAQIEEMETELLVQERLSERIIQVSKDYQGWLEKTLPKRPAVAATLYQNWLVEVCDVSGIKEVQVTPLASNDLPMEMKSLSFVVDGETDYEGLQYFLVTVEQTPLMHQVSEVSVRLSDTEYDDRLDVSLTLKCLIVGGAEERGELLNDSVAKSTDDKINHAHQIVLAKSVSPFLVAREPPEVKPVEPDAIVVVKEEPTEPLVSVTPPPPDYSDRIIQVGTVMTEETRELWVLDQVTKERTVVREGEVFEFYGVSGRLQSVQSRYVVIEINGDRFKWMLATSMKDRESVRRRKRQAS